MKSVNCFVRRAIAAGIMLGLGGGVANAYESSQLIGRIGVATVDPREDSDPIVLGPTADDVLHQGVGVDSDSQVGLTLTYMLTDHVGIELLAATPFKHNITVNDLDIDAGTTKQLPPTISLQYYPLDARSKVQPYGGIGLNYTTFFSEDVDSELETALGTSDVDLSLDDSVGLALEVGVDYEIADRWSVNAAVWWTDIDTEATVSAGAADVKFDVEIDPWVYMIGAAYAF